MFAMKVFFYTDVLMTVDEFTLIKQPCMYSIPLPVITCSSSRPVHVTTTTLSITHFKDRLHLIAGSIICSHKSVCQLTHNYMYMYDVLVGVGVLF